LSHCASKSAHGSLKEASPRKNFLTNFWCYISRIWPDVPLQPIGTNFGLRVRLVDVINCAKFDRNRLRGLDSVRGLILTIPIPVGMVKIRDIAVNTAGTNVAL